MIIDILMITYLMIIDILARQNRLRPFYAIKSASWKLIAVPNPQ